MQHNYFGYKPEELPCYNKEHLILKDTEDPDHNLDHCFEEDNNATVCVFQPCPNRNNWTYSGGKWKTPDPDNLVSVVRKYTEGYLGDLTRSATNEFITEFRRQEAFYKGTVPGEFKAEPSNP